MGYVPGATAYAGRRTDGLAIASLICGIVGVVCFFLCLGVILGPAAAIMGFISRQRIASSGGTLGGGGLALAGLILAATLWAANWLSQLTARAIGRAHRRNPVDTTLQSFAASLVRYFVFVVGMVGVLQQLVSKESNGYVRQRCERALEEMNASVGTF